MGHEFGHILQQHFGQDNYNNGYKYNQAQGWAFFQMKGIWEQLFVKPVLGVDPYETFKMQGSQYNEFDAQYKVNQFR